MLFERRVGSQFNNHDRLGGSNSNSNEWHYVGKNDEKMRTIPWNNVFHPKQNFQQYGNNPKLLMGLTRRTTNPRHRPVARKPEKNFKHRSPIRGEYEGGM